MKVINQKHGIDVGDLVKLKDGSSGIIVTIVNDDPMSRRHPWVVLHTGERFSLRDLEVVNEKG